MIEIKERAQQKMETIQKVNREKSMAKINELTEQHKKEGKHIEPKDTETFRGNLMFSSINQMQFK